MLLTLLDRSIKQWSDKSMDSPWYSYSMVTQKLLRTFEAEKFLERKNLFLTAFDLIKCLQEVKHKRLLHTCVPISELPSNIIIIIPCTKLSNN